MRLIDKLKRWHSLKPLNRFTREMRRGICCWGHISFPFHHYEHLRPNTGGVALILDNVKLLNVGASVVLRAE